MVEKIKPKLSMILMYGALFSLVLMVILFYVERNLLLGNENPEHRLMYYLIIVGGSIVGSMSLSLRTFLLPYYEIEIDEKFVTGPSLFGIGWRKVKIILTEIEEISNNQVLILLGIYIIKSIKGEKICISGFDEDQFNKLMTIINSRRQPKN